MVIKVYIQSLASPSDELQILQIHITGSGPIYNSTTNNFFVSLSVSASRTKSSLLTIQILPLHSITLSVYTLLSIDRDRVPLIT